MDTRTKRMKWACDILGVPHGCEAETWRMAYRDLVAVWHPDKHSNNDRIRTKAEHQIKVISAAKDILDGRDVGAWVDDVPAPGTVPPQPEKARTAESGAPRSARPGPSHAHSTGARNPKPPQAQPKSKAPPKPRPGDFGISEDYYEQAVVGATAYKHRTRIMPAFLKIGIAIALAGLGFLVTSSGGDIPSPLLNYAWLIGMVLAIAFNLFIDSQQEVMDRLLIDQELSPKYNPNPEGYRRYSEALAEWEELASNVHFSRTGRCFHNTKTCAGNHLTETAPRYIARDRGLVACSKCRWWGCSPKRLPQPFGHGLPP